MNSTTTNYSLWQEHFLNLFNSSKAADEKFLSKIRNFHPETTNDCKTDEEENFTLQKKNLIKSIDAFALSLHNATFLDFTLAKKVDENLVILRDVIAPTKLSTLERNNKSEKKKSASRALQELKETIENFPDKNKSVWSSFLDEYEKHLKSIFYASRIKNCTRKKHNKYERYPYLSDLYALCKATNLSPNEVLFDTISNQLCYFNDFKDIRNTIYATTTGKEIFDLFNIQPKEHLAFKEMIPTDRRFRIIFFTELISSFVSQNNSDENVGAFDISKKRENITLKYSLCPRNKAVRLIDKMIQLFKEDNNSAIFDYVLNHRDFDFEISEYYWVFNSNTKTFDFGVPERKGSWNEHNHFMITLNFQLFYISINTILKLHKFYYSDINEDIFISEYLNANPDVLPFLKSLFQLCFFNINQYYVIDFIGNIYQEDDHTDKYQYENVLQGQKTKTSSSFDNALQRASIGKTHDSMEKIDR